MPFGRCCCHGNQGGRSVHIPRCPGVRPLTPIGVAGSWWQRRRRQEQRTVLALGRHMLGPVSGRPAGPAGARGGRGVARVRVVRPAAGRAAQIAGRRRGSPRWAAPTWGAQLRRQGEARHGGPTWGAGVGHRAGAGVGHRAGAEVSHRVRPPGWATKTRRLGGSPGWDAGLVRRGGQPGGRPWVERRGGPPTRGAGGVPRWATADGVRTAALFRRELVRRRPSVPAYSSRPSQRRRWATGRSARGAEATGPYGR